MILAVWSVAFGKTEHSELSLFYGIIYGVLLAAFLLLKNLAMSAGHMALTTLIASSAFLPATAYSVIFSGNSINSIQIIGIALLLMALVLCILGKNEKSSQPLTSKWAVYSILFFFAGGAVRIFYRIFGASAAADEVDFMMLTASAASALLFGIIGLLIEKYFGVKVGKMSVRDVKYALFSAITSCVYIRLNISLSNIIPGAVFFSVSNGITAMLGAICGRVFFKEKLTKLQFLGIILGIFSSVVIGVGQS